MSAAAAAAALALALALPTPAATATPDWPSFGGGDRRLIAEGSTLRPATASSTRRAWVARLDGAVAGSPIVLGAEGLVVVGTNVGSLYGLDLDTGAVRWQRYLGALEVPPCHGLLRPGTDVGAYGVSAAPALDPVTRLVYATEAAGRVFTIQGATGADAAPPAELLPAGQPQEHPWGAVALGAGRVYVTTGGLCPAEPGPTRVVGLDLATGTVRAFDPAPVSASGPTSWGGGGVTVDRGTGTVWAATAFGGPAAPFGGRIVRLSSELRAEARTGRPPQRDRGYASAPVLLQPPGCPPLVMAVARAGRLDVFRRDRLGGRPLVRADLAIEAAGTPTWDRASRRLLVHTYAGVRAFRFAAGCRLRDAWRRTDGGGTASVVAARGVGVAAVRDLRLLRLRDGRLLARLPFAAADRGVALSPPAIAGPWIVAATSGGFAYGFRVPARPRNP